MTFNLAMAADQQIRTHLVSRPLIRTSYPGCWLVGYLKNSTTCSSGTLTFNDTYHNRD